MKRVFVLSIIGLLLIPAVVSAETPKGPNTFLTMEACEAALESGNFRYYVPKYLSNKGRDPVNSVDRIAVPLESDMCLRLQVVGGTRFVVQKEGTSFRARKLADGSLSLYARNDCGNRVYDVVFPPPRVAVVEPEPEPARMVFREPSPPPAEREVVVYRDREKRGGFCSSTRCRVLAALGAGAIGYGVYYHWPCPPGSSRR